MGVGLSMGGTDLLEGRTVVCVPCITRATLVPSPGCVMGKPLTILHVPRPLHTCRFGLQSRTCWKYFFMFQLSSDAAVSAWVRSPPAVVESPEEDLRWKGSLPFFSLYRSSACVRKGHIACLTQRSVRSLGAGSCLCWGFVPLHSCSLVKVSCGNGKVSGGTCSMCNVSCLFSYTQWLKSE